jgi:phenylacetate-CoA ligase
MSLVADPVMPAPAVAGLQSDVEALPREALAALQFERLQATLRNAYAHVPWQQARLKATGYSGETGLASLDELRHLPFTVKTDLRDNYPFGLFTCPVGELARLHASSGTTGKPTVVGYSRADLDIWAQLMARTLYCAGARPGDVVHNAYGYGLFTGGLGTHYGAERLGAVVVPISGGSTERQISLIQDFKPRVLCATPSYALAIAEVAEQMGVDLRKTALRVGVFGAEPWSESMRREIEARIGVKAIDNYGLSEVMGPGVAVECVNQDGLHGWEDHFLFEVVDPETLQPVPEGQAGELVITTLTKQALPMLRYRTRDITRITTAPCSCGRTHLRILRVAGRSDDMLIIRGVNVYPSQIEAVLVGRPGVAPHYQLVVERRGKLDHVTVEVESANACTPDTADNLARDVAHHIKSLVGISTDVRVRQPGELPRSQGKAVRVRDLRPKDVPAGPTAA